jgi:hypothetical protein
MKPSTTPRHAHGGGAMKRRIVSLAAAGLAILTGLFAWRGVDAARRLIAVGWDGLLCSVRCPWC